METATDPATQQPETPTTGEAQARVPRVPAAPSEVRQARVLDPISGQEYYAVYDPASSHIRVDAIANSSNDSGVLFLNKDGQVTGFAADPASAISDEALVELIAQLGLTQAAAQEPAPPPAPAPSGPADTLTDTDITPAQLLTELGKLTEPHQYGIEIDGLPYLATYYPTEQAVKLVPNGENETSKAETVIYFKVDGEQVTATQTTRDEAGNVEDDSVTNPGVADTELATTVLSSLKGLYDKLAGDAATQAPGTSTGQTQGTGPRTVGELYQVLSSSEAPLPLEVPEGASAVFYPATQVVVVTLAGKDQVGVYFTPGATTGNAVPVTLKVDAAGNPVLNEENRARVSDTPVTQELAEAIFKQLLMKYAEINQG